VCSVANGELDGNITDEEEEDEDEEDEEDKEEWLLACVFGPLLSRLLLDEAEEFGFGFDTCTMEPKVRGRPLPIEED